MKNYYVIIDCDPGVDDAMAIMNALNSPNIEVKLISTVSGNLSIDNTLKNTLKLMEIFESNTPVCRGASEPLKRQSVYATNAQGEAGFCGYQFDSVSKKAINIDAVDALHLYLHDNMARNTTILCLGPMTNIAKLLLKYEDDKNYISRIVFMGGSKDENGKTVPYKEFNIAYDPEAVKIVLDSHIPLVMIPMELGHIAYFDKQEQRKINKINKVGHIFYQMFHGYNDYHVGKLGAAVHDSCATLYLTHPEIFKCLGARLDLKYFKSSEGEYGYISCDFRSSDKNARVCVDMDVNKFKNIIYGNLVNYCK